MRSPRPFSTQPFSRSVAAALAFGTPSEASPTPSVAPLAVSSSASSVGSGSLVFEVIRSLSFLRLSNFFMSYSPIPYNAKLNLRVKVLDLERQSATIHHGLSIGVRAARPELD